MEPTNQINVDWVMLNPRNIEEEETTTSSNTEPPQSQSLYSSINRLFFDEITDEDRLISKIRPLIAPVSADHPYIRNQISAIVKKPKIKHLFDNFLDQAALCRKKGIYNQQLRDAKKLLEDKIEALPNIEYFQVRSLEHLIKCSSIEPVVLELLLDSIKNKRYENKNHQPQLGLPLFEKALQKRGYSKKEFSLIWTKHSWDQSGHLVIGMAYPMKRELEVSINFDIDSLFQDPADKSAAFDYLHSRAMWGNPQRNCPLNHDQKELLDAKLNELKRQIKHLTFSFFAPQGTKMADGVTDKTSDMQAGAKKMIRSHFPDEITQDLIDTVFVNAAIIHDFDIFHRACHHTYRLHNALIKHRESPRYAHPAIKELHAAKRKLLKHQSEVDDPEAFQTFVENMHKRAVAGSPVANTAFDLCEALQIPQWSQAGTQIWNACLKAGDDYCEHLLEYLRIYQNLDWPEREKVLESQFENLSKMYCRSDDQSCTVPLIEALASLYQNPAPNLPQKLKAVEAITLPKEISNIVRSPFSHFDKFKKPVQEYYGKKIPITKQFAIDFSRETIIINGTDQYGVKIHSEGEEGALIEKLLELNVCPETIIKVLRFCLQTSTAGNVITDELSKYNTVEFRIGAALGLHNYIHVDGTGKVRLTLEYKKTLIGSDEKESETAGILTTKILFDFDESNGSIDYDKGNIHIIRFMEPPVNNHNC